MANIVCDMVHIVHNMSHVSYSAQGSVSYCADQGEIVTQPNRN